MGEETKEEGQVDLKRQKDPKGFEELGKRKLLARQTARPSVIKKAIAEELT